MKLEKKIIVVDDDTTVLGILKKILSDHGFYVETCESAREAAELLKKEPFYMLITDINMPVVNGIDFTLWVRKNFPDVEIIMISTFDSEKIREFIKKYSVVNYFQKPINLNEIITFITDFSKKGFSKNKVHINFFDFIQMIYLSGDKKLICINDKDTNLTGFLYMKDSEIIHAEYNDKEGLEAFYEMLKIKKKGFSDIPWHEPYHTTIGVKFYELISQLEKIENTGFIDEMEPLSDLELKYDFYRKILIVDDDPITPLIIEKFLLKEGYYVLTVDSAVEASKIMKKHSFGFVITDVMMPQVNGLEFLAWIKKNFSQTEVGIMTSYSSDEAKKFALDSGAFTFFEKPIELKNLLRTIKEVENRKITSDIIELTLIDFIKMILITNQKKLLSIRDPIIGKTYSLFIENGKILHAEGNDKEGIEALNDILNTSTGVFFEISWVEPKKKTINKSISDILDPNKAISEEEKRKLSLNEIFLLKQNLSQYENSTSGKLQEDLSDKNISKFDDLTIYENGTALGITLGSTNRDEVVDIMKKFSQFDINSQIKDRIISYDDLSVGIIFNDNDIAIEMTFGNLYKGSTSKGISLGSKLENAIIAYGTPKVSTLNGLVWDNISLFSSDGIIISSIRLKISSVSEEKPQIKQEVFNYPENYLVFEKKKQVNEIDYTIYPDSLFGITIGRTTRTEINRIMKELFDLSPTEKNLNNRINYDSLSLTFVLNDLKTTKEIIVGSLFKGSTEKGIKIGDSLQKAFKTYGTPLYFSNTSATWREMTLFCDKSGLISSIRIHS